MKKKAYEDMKDWLSMVAISRRILMDEGEFTMHMFKMVIEGAVGD